MTDKEKLEKLKKLADAMYYAAQYLTTDASRLHKAMDEYHQFIIHEYHKEEPTIPDIVDEHWWEMLGEETVSKDLDSFAIKYAQDKPYPATVCQAVKAGANWQKEQDKQWLAENHKHIFAKGRDSMKQQMMAKAITAHCFGFQGDALFSFRLPAKDYLVGSEVKTIVIKED